MTDLYIAVAVAVVVGLVVLSFLNPEAYSRAFVPLAALIVAVWAGCSIWNAGVSAGTDAAAKFADFPKLNDAFEAGYALKVPDFWAKWVRARLWSV